MKNKEIEEILDKLKDKDWYEELDLTGTKWIELKQEETNLLLSYIEQLEKRNKQLYEGFMATQEELTDYATENERLENNRDKAIEQCNDWIKIYKKLNSDERLILRLEEISRILKGDIEWK